LLVTHQATTPFDHDARAVEAGDSGVFDQAVRANGEAQEVSMTCMLSQVKRKNRWMGMVSDRLIMNNNSTKSVTWQAEFSIPDPLPLNDEISSIINYQQN